MMDINKIQSALQSLKEERKNMEEYIKNAIIKKKELDKELKFLSANTNYKFVNEKV